MIDTINTIYGNRFVSKVLRYSDSQVLRYSDSQVLRFADPQVLRFAGSQILSLLSLGYTVNSAPAQVTQNFVDQFYFILYEKLLIYTSEVK